MADDEAHRRIVQEMINRQKSSTAIHSAVWVFAVADHPYAAGARTGDRIGARPQDAANAFRRPTPVAAD